MEFRAHLKNVHMSPQKMRLVRPVVRGLSAQDAVTQLVFMPGKASDIILKVLKSAMANARHNFDADEASLVVGDLIINEGLVMKRFRPMSKGMAYPILKRMSHVTVVLEERGAKRTKAKKAKKTEITDISAEDHVRQNREEVVEEVKEAEAPVVKPTRQKPMPDKQMQAYGKIKSQQKGGNRGQSARRKSLSDSK